MSLPQQLRDQVNAKFQYGYVRYEALAAQLAARPAGAAAAGGPCPALQHFVALCSGGAGGANGKAAAAACLNGKACPSSTDPFVSSLAVEVDRVRLFITSHLEQLWVQLLDLVRRLQGLQAGGLTAGQMVAALQDIEGGLDAFGEEVCLIEQSARQNVLSCALLAQARDRLGNGAAGGDQQQVDGAYLACMECCLLGEGRLDPLLVGLSDAYELLRSLESHASGGKAAKWVPPEKFQRLTRKFWLQPADVTRFKCQVIKHLPILIFGERCKLPEAVPASVAFLGSQAGVRDSGVVSSVYYDNPQTLNTYHTRLRKEDYATAVRVRWYGERSLRGDQPLYVERKLHRDSWSGFFSSKDRAPMQQRFLPDYMAGLGGPPGMEGDSSQAELLREVQEYVAENQQVPFLRTVYRRTAFQKSSDNIVRLSMDTDLQMVRELGAPRLPGDWCRGMGTPLGPGEVVQFPYAVVEIKLQAKPPQWIKELVQSGLLLPLPRYSKFLHGVGVLYQHMTDQLPNWFLPDEADPSLLTPATWEEMADTSDQYLQSAASWLFPASFDAPPPGSGPFSFLRRPKPALLAPAAPGTSRGAAAAAARRMTEFDLACERLPDAESAPSEAGSSREEGSTGSGRRQAEAAQRAEQQARSQQQAPAAAAVPRSTTWPVYQNPTFACGSAAAAGDAGRGANGLLLASYAGLEGAAAVVAARQEAAAGAAHSAHHVRAESNPLLLKEAAEAAGAAEAGGPGLQRASVQSASGGQLPGRSDEGSSGTPMDSAKDIESGKVTIEGEEAGGKPSPAARGLQQRGPTTTSAFGSQLYRQLGGGGGGPAAGGKEAGGLAPKKGSSRGAALVRTRVEPKTFFANERTFLQWLQISVLVMMIAFSLLSGSLVTTTSGGMTGSATGTMACPTGDNSCMASKISGAIIAPVALLFMGYALFMYRARTIQILRRETVRYDDQRGPVVLVGVLLAVLVVAYVVSLIWIF